jgi:hypothetical protein
MLVAEIERESLGLFSGAGDVGPHHLGPHGPQGGGAFVVAWHHQPADREVALPKHLGVKTLFLNV